MSEKLKWKEEPEIEDQESAEADEKSEKSLCKVEDPTCEACQ